MCGDNWPVRVYLEPRRFVASCHGGREGFTLVELIVVVVITGVLASIGVPAFQRSTIKARQAEAALLVNSYIKGVQVTLQSTRYSHLRQKSCLNLYR